MLETAERTAQPFMLHVAEHYGSALALCDGRLDEAEAMANRSREWGRLLTGRDASGTYGIQMFSIRREQDACPELAPAVRILAGSERRAGPWEPGLVVLLAELGMESEARRELARLASEGIDPFRESLWLATLAYLTDASAALGDEAVAALVYPELEALSGANMMIGHLVFLLRRRRPLPGYARGDARRIGPRRTALRARPGAEQAYGRVDVGGPHRVRVRALPGRAAARRARSGRAAHRGSDEAGEVDRNAWAAGQDRFARVPCSAPAFPMVSPPGRFRSWAWSRRA